MLTATPELRRPLPPIHGAPALARLVETEIVPRLVANRRAQSLGDVDQLVALLLAPANRASATADMLAFLDAQAALHDAAGLLLDFVTPAARRLGDLWVEDVADFVQVTIGAQRLQRALDEIAPTLPSAGAHGRRALLGAAPEDQHRLGLAMVAAFLRADGWSVTLTAGDAALAAGADPFDAVLLSAGAATRLPALTDLIRRTRCAARNRHVPILAGGPAFLTASGDIDPRAAALVGADVVTADAPSAVREANRLALRAGRARS